MPKYMCLMRSAPGGQGKQVAPSPAQMQEMFASFNAWREKFKDQIVDLGGKLLDLMCVITNSPARRFEAIVGIAHGVRRSPQADPHMMAIRGQEGSRLR